jgi:hypothetical protein
MMRMLISGLMSWTSFSMRCTLLGLEGSLSLMPPYIMFLIKHAVYNSKLLADEDHKVKRPYIKRKGPRAAAPTGPAVCLDTFMRDARTNASSHAQSAAAWAATREFKQLSWFQKNILCMNVEIHRENYQAYVERKSIMDT